MRFTVLGGAGFIGSYLQEALRKEGREFIAPERGSARVFAEPLGHVFYCIGLTADFRERTQDTLRAHVTYLAEMLERASFDSLLYLSSTRVYAKAASASEETPPFADPRNPDDFYNLTKLTGESLCLMNANPRVRVARLSNVYGDDLDSKNFLSSVIRDALDKGHVELGTTPDSSKDYVSVQDVARLLPRIAAEGRERLYNVASGENVSNEALLAVIARLTGCSVRTASGARRVQFAPINIGRVRREFGFDPARILDDLPQLVGAFRPGPARDRTRSA